MPLPHSDRLVLYEYKMNRALKVLLPKSSHVKAEAKRSEEVPVYFADKIHRVRPETSHLDPRKRQRPARRAKARSKHYRPSIQSNQVGVHLRQ